MSWESGWKHTHVCTGCGRMAVCWNPSCTEPEVCPECEEAESIRHQLAAFVAKILACVSDRPKGYEIPSKAIAEGVKCPRS